MSRVAYFRSLAAVGPLHDRLSGVDGAITSAQAAAQSHADAAIAALVGSAPEVLDTLQEISQALGNDANLAATLTNQIASAQAAAEATAASALAAEAAAIRGEFAAADILVAQSSEAASASAITAVAAAIRSEFAAADTAVRAEFAAADATVRSEFASADAVVAADAAAAAAAAQSAAEATAAGALAAAVSTQAAMDAAQNVALDALAGPNGAIAFEDGYAFVAPVPAPAMG